ncbi:uncharacterized protein UTRI_01835 [Ustilago trichophora]|uniref:Uncharacterized protein n=1 Tax=Ustilago trichophora TaxID=86804 RepID=A0A5C3E0S9_9BASI|nr:uncharacterized protein UTRI_01835 [Ustilago trichophora]
MDCLCGPCSSSCTWICRAVSPCALTQRAEERRCELIDPIESAQEKYNRSKADPNTVGQVAPEHDQLLCLSWFACRRRQADGDPRSGLVFLLYGPGRAPVAQDVIASERGEDLRTSGPADRSTDQRAEGFLLNYATS